MPIKMSLLFSKILLKSFFLPKEFCKQTIHLPCHIWQRYPISSFLDRINRMIRIFFAFSGRKAIIVVPLWWRQYISYRQMFELPPPLADYSSSLSSGELWKQNNPVNPVKKYISLHSDVRVQQDMLFILSPINSLWRMVDRKYAFYKYMGCLLSNQKEIEGKIEWTLYR